jgi:hypothetical protein
VLQHNATQTRNRFLKTRDELLMILKPTDSVKPLNVQKVTHTRTNFQEQKI